MGVYIYYKKESLAASAVGDILMKKEGGAVAERITSRANPLMTHIRKLASSRSYRRQCGEYLGTA